MTGLTPKQARCLSAIKARLGEGVSPSYTELQGDLGYASVGQVHRDVHQLVRRGKITVIPHASRSIELTAKPFELPTQSQLDELSDADSERLWSMAADNWASRGGDTI